MSRYVSHSYASVVAGKKPFTSSQNGGQKAGASKRSVKIATATQAPTFGQTVKEVKETKTVTVQNNDGGVSFSLAETFRLAVGKNDSATASSVAITIIERLAIFGTSETRVDINSTKLTSVSRDLFYEISKYNVDLVMNTLKSVYDDARAPKNSHMVYLVALLTSANKSTTPLTDEQSVLFRTKGYKFVPFWRIPTHFIDWANTHLALCSMASDKKTDKPLDPVESVLGSVSSSSRMRGALRGRGLRGRGSVRGALRGKGGRGVQRRGVQKRGVQTLQQPKEKKPARAGGTGNGFRSACKAWYLKYCSSSETAQHLASHICKKPSHEGTSHKDILSLIHLETTTKKKCICKSKSVCKCEPAKPEEYTNLIPIACQIPLAYAVYGIDHAVKIMLEGIDRLIHNGGDPSVDSNIKTGFNVLAFLCAVTRAKNEHTSTSELCDLIRLFGLTREMVSNTQLQHQSVLMALTIKKAYHPFELVNKRRELLLEKVPLQTLVTAIYPDSESIEKKSEEKTDQNTMRICMPITALIRNLNRLTIAGLFNNDNSGTCSGTSLVNAVSTHLTNPEVLHKGMVHPINIFSAWATYSKGQGFKGSQTWTPVSLIEKSLLDAVEVSFKGLTGFDATCAFFMDASSSMSTKGSAPGLPNLVAMDVAVMMMLSFYRATVNFAVTNNKLMQNHIVGYFGGNFWSHDSKKRPVSAMISMDEMKERSKSFVDITEKLPAPNLLTFDTMKQLLGNGEHMGTTDIGSALWYLIRTLKASIEKVQTDCSSEDLSADLTVFRLNGYVNLILFVTDNDVNSGDQPTDVLALYRGLVRQAFQLLPFNRDGVQEDPEKLYSQYIPRMVVVATQGGDCTIGDPRDSNILNVSGFDSSGPAIINAFLNANSPKHKSDSDNDYTDSGDADANDE